MPTTSTTPSKKRKVPLAEQAEEAKKAKDGKRPTLQQQMANRGEPLPPMGEGMTLSARIIELKQTDDREYNGKAVKKGEPNGIGLQATLTHPDSKDEDAAEAMAKRMKMQLHPRLKTASNKAGNAECFGKPIWVKALQDGSAYTLTPVQSYLAITFILAALEAFAKDISAETDFDVESAEDLKDKYGNDEDHVDRLDIQSGDIGYGKVFCVQGDTYQHRHTLAKKGGKYHSALKGYVFRDMRKKGEVVKHFQDGFMIVEEFDDDDE